MSNKNDSLWWAAARGDEDLVRDLLERQQKGFTFDIGAAKNAALKYGHAHLIDTLDNNFKESAWVIFGNIETMEGRNDLQHIQSLFERIDFPSLTNEEQEQLLEIHPSLFRQMRGLLNKWLSQINQQTYVEELGSLSHGVGERNFRFGTPTTFHWWTQVKNINIT